MSKRQFYIFVSIIGICMVAFLVKVQSDSDRIKRIQNGDVELGGTFYPVETTAQSEITVTEVPVTTEDPDNLLFPYNTMSMDWGAELYDSGFKVYTIPDQYKKYGGCFPEVVQAYLWQECKARGVNYYMVVSIIERESGYRYNRTGDDGNSKGYMQVYEKYHYERMIDEDALDLYNPYHNIRVGLNFLQEIYNSYGSSGEHCVLMVYNMGETTARSLWSKEIYSTEYSREIMSRAQEIEQELTQE